MPGSALAVALRSEPAQTLCLGCDAAGHDLVPESLFPVASVTKLATALAVLRLVEAGRLALDDSLAEHLPEAAAARPGVTPRALLSHTAGLPLDLPDGAAPYRRGLTWRALASACLRVSLEREPGTYVQYSNVGPGLLAVIVERQTGQDFAAALTQLVLDPLGIEGYLGAEPPRAPVAIGGIAGAHAGTELETFNSAFWRALALPWGGLVMTLTGALARIQVFAGRAPSVLGPEICAEVTRDQTGGPARGHDTAAHLGPVSLGIGSTAAWHDAAALCAARRRTPHILPWRSFRLRRLARPHDQRRVDAARCAHHRNRLDGALLPRHRRGAPGLGPGGAATCVSNAPS
jgi:CubicO group peptidase (beta-lactamase class C family)